MPTDPKAVGQHVEGSPRDKRFGDAGADRQAHRLRPGEYTQRRSTLGVVSGVDSQFVMDALEAPLPLLRKAVLVLVEFSDEEQLVSVPTRTLLERPLVVVNCARDPSRACPDKLELPHEHGRIVGGLRRVIQFVKDEVVVYR